MPRPYRAAASYHQRHAPGHLKQWRGIATRCGKHAGNYRAAVVLASLLWWLDE